ncbi:MAG: hypothetical protein VX075_15055, partial [Pseudomonadota bacterium]|nr:hypothetical protein [Pseudomonadota bacterium]
YESGASWNKVNFSNADVDAAIRVMEGEVDLDKRNAAIAKAIGFVNVVVVTSKERCWRSLWICFKPEEVLTRAP